MVGFTLSDPAARCEKAAESKRALLTLATDTGKTLIAVSLRNGEL
ncbi:MAG: hypothetical protein ACREJ6_12675 [Candidatus Methylomirabilis sp.]